MADKPWAAAVKMVSHKKCVESPKSAAQGVRYKSICFSIMSLPPVASGSPPSHLLSLPSFSLTL